MTDKIRIIVEVKGAYRDVEIEYCDKHHEWFTAGCQQCTVDEMLRDGETRFNEGFEAGKKAANA